MSGSRPRSTEARATDARSTPPMELFDDPPPLPIIEELFRELSDMANEVDIDVDWKQNLKAADRACTFTFSYFSTCIMAEKGWDCPQRTESTEHRVWCVNIMKMNGICDDDMRREAAVYFAADPASTRRYLQCMKSHSVLPGPSLLLHQ